MKNPVTLNVLVLEQKIILGLSLPLAVLLVVCSAVGLLYPEIYNAATPNWRTQALVQDGVDLFLVTPVFLVAALYSYQGVRLAFLMWGGSVGYLTYTFLIYCFAVHFNVLFLPYCLVLGLSFFSSGWFVLTQVRAPVVTKLQRRSFQTVAGIYFVIISVVFYALWLLEVVPASISNQVSKTLLEAGLITNPVHVIDLSVCLPFVFITGVMAIKAKPFTLILIPAILIFFILMDVTIAALTIVMLQNGHGGSMAVAYMMGALTLVSLGLLITYIIQAKNELGS